MADPLVVDRPPQLARQDGEKVLLGGKWSVGDFELATTASRYGEISVLNADPTRDQTFGAEWTLDLSFAYSYQNWKFTLGGDNVLNEYPDEVLYANSTFGQLPYSGSAPFGFNGAFMYANVNYKW